MESELASVAESEALAEEADALASEATTGVTDLSLLVWACADGRTADATVNPGRTELLLILSGTTNDGDATPTAAGGVVVAVATDQADGRMVAGKRGGRIEGAIAYCG